MPLPRFWNARIGWSHSSYGLVHVRFFDWCSIPAAGPVPGAGARLGVSFGEEIVVVQVVRHRGFNADNA